MIIKTLLSTGLIFAVIYPLCFRIQNKYRVKKDAIKSHLFLLNLIGGIVVVLLMFTGLPLIIKIIVIIWKVSLISVSSYCRKRKKVDINLMIIPPAIGIYAFFCVQKSFFASSYLFIFLKIITGAIICAAVYLLKIHQDSA